MKRNKSNEVSIQVKHIIKYSIVLSSFLVIRLSLGAQTSLILPKLISDGMVLQCNRPLNLWGWAAPGVQVHLEFNNKTYTTKTEANGKWKMRLPAQKPGGPFEMIFRAGNEVRIQDILFGDVWICSGQSNMELTMERVKYKYANEISAAKYSSIRQFTVPDRYNFKMPEGDLRSGKWIEASGTSILEFSAVAYFFAKEIYEKYKIPIGLINAALGGSPAECWISGEAIEQFPGHYNEWQKFKNDSLISQIENNARIQGNAWNTELNAKDPGLTAKWKNSEVDDQDWKTMQVPALWADAGMGNFNGSAWFRKKFNLPGMLEGKQARLEMGRIVDADSVFINGTYVGNTTYQYPPRRYAIPAGLLKAENNTIVVRIVNNSGRGGFVKDKPYRIIFPEDTIDLKGEWKFKQGATMDAMPGSTTVRWKPVGLFNAMIAPLLNYSIKGVIWYQGESNTADPSGYRELMKTLIHDWRNKWKQGNFPFIYVQLANFMEVKPDPVESNWAVLRQAQLKTLDIPQTGMAVAIDAGEWNDVHPENKQDVGHRLALEARRLAYGEKKIVSTGPLYQSATVSGNKMIISFKNTGSGLSPKGGSSLQQFAIAGVDHIYYWAKAEIKGNKVIVWSEKVNQPVTVRYAWADNPAGANLYNKEGLPASPFGTGD